MNEHVVHNILKEHPYYVSKGDYRVCVILHDNIERGDFLSFYRDVEGNLVTSDGLGFVLRKTLGDEMPIAICSSYPLWRMIPTIEDNYVSFEDVLDKKHYRTAEVFFLPSVFREREFSFDV